MRKAIVYFFFILTSCSKYSPEIRNALKLAESNKNELIKVLEHYHDEGDSLKLAAAEFLVSNLPYNYAYDTTNLKIYRTISLQAELHWQQYDSIDTEKLNKRWDVLRAKNPPYNAIFSKPITEDIKVIKSDFLIKNIDEAYKAWSTNPYAKDSVGFNDFCEYVLPYRQIQGKAIEPWRQFFKNQNRTHFSDLYPLPFQKACDSFFSQYKDYTFNYWLTQGLPMLKFKDYLKMKSSNCAEKSWFNTYAVNAEGIPMAVDFVPAWGSREDDHQWNAIIYGGKTLYFESFWEKDNPWTYNPDVNSNTFVDEWMGKIRLPKVYRHTYSTHFVGPMADGIKLENIPALFRNVKQKDVSEQYFNAVDVTIEIPENIPSETSYVYLAVLGVDKHWVPVQWGKIENDKIQFKKMGTDIVYQPVFFKKGKVTPFGNPFHVDHNGKKRDFFPEKDKEQVLIKRKYPSRISLVNDAKLIKGARIQAANKKDFSDAITLKTIDFEPELRPYDIVLNTNNKHTYFRIISEKPITIKEISLFSGNKKNNGVPLEGNFITSKPLTKNNPNTYTWKGVELKEKQQVAKIRFAPPNNLNHVLKGYNYELFYIDKGVFVSLGKQKANAYELIYENVPKSALLFLKCLDEGRQERIFEYKNGKQIWY